MKTVLSELQKSGVTPYLIPIGGSNAMGAWGYIEAFKELMTQVRILQLMQSSNIKILHPILSIR